MQENKRLAESADVLLVSDVPYGRGNIKNLELLLSTDRPVYMKRRHSQIDFTGGAAEAIIKELEKKDNFRYIESYEEFMEVFN